MKTFDEIYEEIQSGDNKELQMAWEIAKKKNEKANEIALITCLIIDIFAIIIFLSKGISSQYIFLILPSIIFLLVINLFVVVIINILFTGKEKNIYNEKYKKVVINKLMNNFYENLEYFPQKSIPEHIYKEAKYDEFYDNYESEDYFEAQINNEYSIQMAEVHIQEEQEYEDSNGETQTREITKFHGLFAKIVMDKSINSELRIMQNGEILSKNRLKMDSSEFEKYFDVKASDKIIGMQLLTADVMEELIAFIEKTNMKYDICLKNNELYIRFHCGAMFEPGNIKKGMIDKTSLQKYFYMLNFTYNLTNKLIKLVNDTHI